MPARILDGTLIASQIRESVAPGVAAFTARANRAPCLGIVLVGDDPASEIYVRNKVKAGFEDLGTQTLKNIAEPHTARGYSRGVTAGAAKERPVNVCC